MEWTIKLEARTGWGEVETIKEGRLKRRVVRLTAQEIGLPLAGGKEILSELQRLSGRSELERHRCHGLCTVRGSLGGGGRVSLLAGAARNDGSRRCSRSRRRMIAGRSRRVSQRRGDQHIIGVPSGRGPPAAEADRAVRL